MTGGELDELKQDIVMAWLYRCLLCGDSLSPHLQMPKKRDCLEEKLFKACTQGNLSLVEEYIKNGANINKICSCGRTPLGVAAEMGFTNILNIFFKDSLPSTSKNLGYFVMVHSDSDDSLPSLHNSPKGIDFDDFNDSLVQRFGGIPERDFYCDEFPEESNLEWDSEIDESDYEQSMNVENDPWASLYVWYASILSQTGALLCEEPCADNVDSADRFGCSAMHYAASEGHVDVMHLLLHAGSKINVQDSENFTPLHMASAKDRVEVVEYLIKQGANLHSRSTDGITALHVAASRGLLDNTRLLIASGANVNAVDISDRTPLYLAVSQRQHAVSKFLIENGAKVNLEEIHGYTPVYEAVCRRDLSLLEMLLAAGAKMTQSHHLLHYATLNEQESIVRALLRAGCVIDLRNESGDTSLMLAVRTQNTSMVRLLLQNGASFYCMGYQTRKTALQDVIDYVKSDCQRFEEFFSIFEEFGWNWAMEKSVIFSAVSAKNDHAVVTLVKRCALVTDRCLENSNDLINLLIRRGNNLLLKLIILAGFDLNRCVLSVPCPEWLLHYVRNPMSLQSLSRICIRKCLKQNIFLKLEDLRIPHLMKRFIRFDEFVCPCRTN